VLRTRWPWLGAGIAALIWAPNVVWQATHGWPQPAMAAALHQSGSTPSDYAAGVPAQLVFAGLLVTPLVIAGYVRLWRATELGFLAVTCTLLVIYVLVWVPGRQYYAEGTVAVVLAHAADRDPGRGTAGGHGRAPARRAPHRAGCRTASPTCRSACVPARWPSWHVIWTHLKHYN
jgi:hypothetical protein